MGPSSIWAGYDFWQGQCSLLSWPFWPFQVKFSSTSESIQTLQADLCYVKRCSCVVFSLKVRRKDLTNMHKSQPPPPLPLCPRMMLTLSLLRVINVKFPLQPTRNITSHSKESLAFHSLLRWKMIVIQILATSLMHFLFKGRENVLFELRARFFKARLA